MKSLYVMLNCTHDYFCHKKAECAKLRRQKELELEVLTGTIRDWEGESIHNLGDIVHMGSVAVGKEHKDRYFVLFPEYLVLLSVSARMSAFIYQVCLALVPKLLKQILIKVIFCFRASFHYQELPSIDWKTPRPSRMHLRSREPWSIGSLWSVRANLIPNFGWSFSNPKSSMLESHLRRCNPIQLHLLM